MRFLPTDLVDFWLMPWSAPFRAACCWVVLLGAPLQGSRPDSDAPKWLRLLCLQRWVAQAIAARLAWLSNHPNATAYRFGHESEPDWTEVAYARYDRRCLRELREATLLWIFGMEVERLLRITQEAPTLVGQGDWTMAALGASEHVAQVYAELKRRHKAMRARATLREELRRFVEGAGNDTGTYILPEAGDEAPAGESPQEPDVLLVDRQ